MALFNKSMEIAYLTPRHRQHAQVRGGRLAVLEVTSPSQKTRRQDHSTVIFNIPLCGTASTPRGP